MDLCSGLIILGVVLTVVTVVGHGLWLLAAALFRVLEQPSPVGTRQRRCPACGSRSVSIHGRCHDCHAIVSQHAPPAQADDPWQKVERQLNRLHTSGRLSEARYRQLKEILREEQNAAEQRSAPAPRTPSPAPEVSKPPEEVPLEVVDFEKPKPAARPAAKTPPAAREPAAAAAAVVRREPPPPQRDWGRFLQAFMEEKNIRWGELVSGMLIVGSAIGLVISLWSTLQNAIPYFPALLFMLGTAAIHGAGLYTLKRWNLKSTSRGLLVISTLLIPLNVMAAIALSGEPGSAGYVEATSPEYLLAVAIGLLCYGAISFSASRVFRPRHWWVMWLAVMVPSIGQLVISRFAAPLMSPVSMNLLAALPLGGFTAAIGAQLTIVSRRRALTRRSCEQTFQVLGIGAFSWLMALGLLAVRSGAWFAALAELAPSLSLFAVLVTATGLLVQHRATRTTLATQRTAGTAVSLFGSALMLAGLVLAWPRPELLVAVGVVDVIALTSLAITSRLPVLHWPAIAALGLTAVTGLHWGQGLLEAGPDAGGAELLDALLMGRSGLVLLGLGAVCFTPSLLVKNGRFAGDAFAYRWGAAGLATFSLLIAFVDGFITARDQSLTTPIFAVAAGILLAVCWMKRQRWAAWAGTALLFVACVHAFLWNEPVAGFLQTHGWAPRDPVILSGLIAATIAGLGAVACALLSRGLGKEERGRNHRFAIEPLCLAAWVTSACTLFATLVDVRETFGVHSGYLFWITGLWGAAAWMLQTRRLWIAAQAISFLAVGFAATFVAEQMTWWSDNFADPRYWQCLLASLAIACMLWTILRRSIPGNTPAAKLLGRGGLNVDHAVVAAAAIAAVFVTLGGVLPGIAAELAAPGVSVHAQTLAQPLLPDVLAATMAVLLMVAGLFAVSSAACFKWTMPLSILGGVFVVGVLLTQLSNVSAESYAAAVGTSHLHATGSGGWMLAAIVLLALLITLWERASTAALCGATVIGGLVPVLIAGAFEANLPTATALRFGLAVYAVALCVVFALRDPLGRACAKLGCHLPAGEAATFLPAVRSTGIAVTVWPVLALSLRGMLRVLRGGQLELPATEWFGRLDLGLSYAAPLWLLGLTMLAVAVVRRHHRFAISASLFLQLGMVLMYLLPQWYDSGRLPVTGLVELLQWIAIGLGACSLLWIAGLRSLTRQEMPAAHAETDRNTMVPFWIQLGWTAAHAAMLSLWAALAIIASPTSYGPVIAQLGAVPGLISFALAVAALVVSYRDLYHQKLKLAAAFALPGCLLFAVPLLAAAISPLGTRLEIADSWLTYHTLIAGWGAGMVTLAAMSIAVQRLQTAPGQGETHPAGAGRLTRIPEWGLRSSALFLAALLVMLGLRSQAADPQRPWWLVGTAAAAAAVNFGFGVVRRKEAYAYASTGLALLATAAALSRPWLGIGPAPTIAVQYAMFETLMITLAVAGLAWLGVEVFRQRRPGGRASTSVVPLSLHHAAVITVAVLTAGCALQLLFARELARASFAEALPTLLPPRGAIMLWSGIVAAVATLWDRRGAHALPALYVLVLACGVALLDGINAGAFFSGTAIDLDEIWFGLGLIAALQVALASALWGARRPLGEIASRMGIAEEATSAGKTEAWLPPANLGLAGFVTVIGFWSVLHFADPALRYTAAAAAAILVPGFAVFAGGKLGATFRMLTLAAGVSAAVQLAWAIPFEQEIGPRALWLQHAIRLLEVLSLGTLLYAVGVSRLSATRNPWGRSLKVATAALGGTAIATLSVVLIMEGVLFRGEPVPITNFQVGLISLILLGLAGGLILLAVAPQRDPLQLSDRSRAGYVYAAEIVASLLFFHIYVTKPELFRGYLQPYWPYIVIGIAFAGVGLAELFRRRQLRVLSEPLERSGAFLPLLPVLAFWFVATDKPFHEYSLTLIMAGLVYILLASLRRSFLYSIAAGAMANFSLWSMYHHLGIDIFSRPQVWLIPPALSLLLAAQLNRSRLTENRLAAIRYCSILIIYVSSTGEMFIRGVEEDFWHPVILASLSVAGVLSGMLLRIRSFLYLGTTFLLLSLVSMVWQAASLIDEVWPWWVFGIVLGLLMLALFGIFEKKRQEVLGILNQMKKWDR